MRLGQGAGRCDHANGSGVIAARTLNLLVGHFEPQHTEFGQGRLDDIDDLIVALWVRGLEKKPRVNEVMDAIVQDPLESLPVIELHPHPETFNRGMGIEEFNFFVFLVSLKGFNEK